MYKYKIVNFQGLEDVRVARTLDVISELISRRIFLGF